MAAGNPGNPELYKKLNKVITPVVTGEIKDSDLSALDSDSGIIPFDKLEPRQQRFIDEWMVDLNNTAAAIRAGYSPRTAKEQGSRLFTDVNIRAHVDRRLAEASRRTGVNELVVVRELARIARANPAKVVAEDGSILATASDDDLAAIQSIKVKTTTNKSGVTVEREVRFNDKNKSLELLMRHMGMLVDRKQVDVHQTIETMTSEERERRIQELLAKRDTIDITPQ
jgi:phage terminase small subunit